MMRKFVRPPSPARRQKIDSVTQIIKRVCGLSQSEAFLIAKAACVWSVAKRSAAGTTSGKED